MKKILIITSLLATVGLYSCSKWDEYKQYTQNGEVVYTGILDSVKVYSGKERVRVTGKFNADPKITALKIYWHDKADSVVYEVKRVTGNQYFDQTFPVTEGAKTFLMHTFDGEGNKSVPIRFSGTSYGQNYRKRLYNRPIASLAYGSGNTTINWDVFDMSTGALRMEVNYAAIGDSLVKTPIAETKTVLNGFNFNTESFKYRTIFRPDSTSIDTFATQFIVR